MLNMLTTELFQLGVGLDVDVGVGGCRYGCRCGSCMGEGGEGEGEGEGEGIKYGSAECEVMKYEIHADFGRRSPKSTSMSV